MHNAAMAEMAQVDPEFNNWTYYKFQIHPDNLHQALDMFHSNGFLGLNLTVPHKVLATQWIKIGESAVKLSGASNTLIRGVDGYKGYNTDLYGLVKALESGFGINLQDQEVILLGAGGAARAAAIACAQAGGIARHGSLQWTQHARLPGGKVVKNLDSKKSFFQDHV